MRAIKRNEINPIKMSVNPPKEIVNCGMKIINSSDKHIYCYVGIGWIKEREVTREDYLEIPELID